MDRGPPRASRLRQSLAPAASQDPHRARRRGPHVQKGFGRPEQFVLQVDPQSAAERAGLKPGDPVTELDGTPVRDAADLQLRLALLRIGEVAEFAVSRDGGFRSSAWVFRSSASRSARNALL